MPATTKKLDTNINELVELSVCGDIVPAVWPKARLYRMGGDGQSRVLPGTGGICYSHQVGDNACQLQGDHVEPGVSIKNSNGDFNSSLNTLACIGNDATVISGPAKGAKGTVCGLHGGVEHVIVDFPEVKLTKLTIGDKVQIRAKGVGLAFSKHPEVRIINADPRLLDRWGLNWSRGKLRVPVTHVIPAAIMGSGLGSPTCHRGDYDIQLFDRSVNKEYRLDTLRFGDLVAIADADHSFGRRFLRGAISVGVIVHSRSDVSGHGPGVTSLLTSETGAIKPVVDKKANIGSYLRIGRWRRGSRRR